MALLGEIRRRSWLLIFMIALGMGGFLLMDMSGPGGGGLSGGQNVGSINGKKISIQDYQRRLNQRQNPNVNSFENNKSVWDQLVLENILDDEGSNLGFGVSGNELRDLMTGDNISPIVYRNFVNPQTGQFDKNNLVSLYNRFTDRDQTLPLETKYAIRDLEEQVVLNQKVSKLSSIVGSALYTPKWLAEKQKSGQLTSAEVSYAVIPFAEIPDNQVNVSDADLTGYLNNNAHLYKTDEETRTVEYVSFDVEATEEDKTNIRSGLDTIARKFRDTDDVEQFVQNNYGTYDTRYVMKDELSTEVADELFESANGDVVGPYLDDGYYRITKLIDRRAVPDSVKSRHILIRADRNNPAAVIDARKTIDSLKTILEAERKKKRRKRSPQISFDSLALNFGQDGTSTTGGDLGYQGPVGFVNEFRDLIFYEAEKGELNVLETQFGVHLVEVTGVKSSGKTGVRVANISQYITPSKATQDGRYNEAIEFVQNNKTLEAMRNAAQQNGMSIQKAEALKINDYTAGALDPGESSRSIVKFAFNASPGDVSPAVFTFDEDAVDFYNDAYVVAALGSVHPAGMPPVDAVRSIITQQVIKEKKGNVIQSKIGNNLDAVSSNYADVSTEDRTFNFPLGMPNEPKVNAAIKGLANGQTKTVVGDAGVYVIKMNSKTEADGSDMAKLQNTLGTQTRQEMLQSTTLIDALKKKADVSDQRFTFY